MTIIEFAENRSLKVRKDACGELIIPGKQHHIFEFGSTRLGICFMFPVDVGSSSGKSAKWHNARKRLVEAGFTIRQDGDAEGTALFDPTDNTQAKLAIKLAGCRVRKKLSSEQRQALTDRLANARQLRAAA